MTPSLQFQSTHPVWDATFVYVTPFPSFFYFNPRIPCGMRRESNRNKGYLSDISIHASRVGCDSACLLCVSLSHCYFNPRIPCGMRLALGYAIAVLEISIHASRVGCDQFLRLFCALSQISIHASRVGCDVLVFLSNISDLHISIHASRVGCDTDKDAKKFYDSLFQSTHPVWDATDTGEVAGE